MKLLSSIIILSQQINYKLTDANCIMLTDVQLT
jgi:hypothetical protein